ncbi:molybdenum cofactor guanylyltransferase [Cohnella cellulosilytica]|uniref:Probable molybdenum cofactor guanylyltransferase n=1 Tax=Cohnella cellulosilytica TaxID=986710 RepID=A0ABW2FBJ6_9BACL
MKQTEVTTVILAGGEGRRMGGRNKALLTLGQETLISRQLREASRISADIVVVANDPQFAEQLRVLMPSVRVVPDVYPGEGPLAGVHAGFQAAASPHVWLLGCDQPYPSADAATYLLGRLDRAQAAIPLIGGRLQPLHAVYRQETGAIAEELLRAGKRRLRDWLDRLELGAIGQDELQAAGFSLALADDIDTPERLAEENARWAEHTQQRS